MNRRDELKQLMIQKRVIEARIQSLKAGTTIFGDAKIAITTNGYHSPYLAIKTHGSNERWVTVYESKEMKNVVDAIPKIVEDLNGLYEKMKEDADYEQICGGERNEYVD